jgi:hypothetical protein
LTRAAAIVRCVSVSDLAHVEGWRCNVEGSGFVFGLLAFVFAIGAWAKIRRLEQQLREAGVLKANHESG